jgi:hypothetical protein
MLNMYDLMHWFHNADPYINLPERFNSTAPNLCRVMTGQGFSLWLDWWMNVLYELMVFIYNMK